jgi:hypothetical protein
MIWGNLLHLSYNMWNDRECAENPLYWACARHSAFRPHFMGRPARSNG